MTDNELCEIILDCCRKYVKDYYKTDLPDNAHIDSSFNEDLMVDSLGRIMVFMAVAEKVGLDLIDMENELSEKIDGVKTVRDAITAWREIEKDKTDLPEDTLEL